jgi:hypothetical protein
MDILNSELVEKFIELNRTIEEQNLLVNALKLDVESRDRELGALEAVIVVREAALTESALKSTSDAKLTAALNQKIITSLSSEESLKSETEFLSKKIQDVTSKLLEKNKAFQSLIEQQLSTTQELSDLTCASLVKQTLITEEKICLEEKIQLLQSKIIEQVTAISHFQASTTQDKISLSNLAENSKFEMETKNSEFKALKIDFDAKIAKMDEVKEILDAENGKLKDFLVGERRMVEELTGVVSRGVADQRSGDDQSREAHTLMNLRVESAQGEISELQNEIREKNAVLVSEGLKNSTLESRIFQVESENRDRVEELESQVEELEHELSFLTANLAETQDLVQNLYVDAENTKKLLDSAEG